MRGFFEQLEPFLGHPRNWQKVVLSIDEFDAIPQAAIQGFLHVLRFFDMPCVELRKQVRAGNTREISATVWAAIEHRKPNLKGTGKT